MKAPTIAILQEGRRGGRDIFSLSGPYIVKSLSTVSPQMKVILGLGDEKMENTEALFRL